MAEQISKYILTIATLVISNISFLFQNAQREVVSFYSPPKGKTVVEIVLPSKVNSPTTTRVVDKPMSKDNFSEDTQSSRPTIPWGQTEKVAEHTYRTYVGDDPEMSTNEQLTDALNKYRSMHGLGELVTSGGLCKIADMRISQLEALQDLDAHKGFKEYLEVDANWSSIPRFVSLGENNSYGYHLSGTHLIEWVFDADEEHRSNQLNPNWNRVCVRISGTIVEIIFGQET